MKHWLCAFLNFWHYRVDLRGRWWISRQLEAWYCRLVGGEF